MDLLDYSHVQARNVAFVLAARELSPIIDNANLSNRSSRRGFARFLDKRSYGLNFQVSEFLSPATNPLLKIAILIQRLIDLKHCTPTRLHKMLNDAYALLKTLKAAFTTSILTVFQKLIALFLNVETEKAVAKKWHKFQGNPEYAINKRDSCHRNLIAKFLATS